tara:strand:- start:2864 stop:3223 length:360 start_codon:yes stop_codon:yes gene_type:complete
MAYNLTPEELLQLAEQVNASGEEPYDMGQRHQYEIMVAELKGAQNQAADEQNQAAYDNQMQTWENQGVPPENLVRAKAQLATYFGVPGTQPTPPAQGASVPASPTQGDLINPANPMKLV